MEIRPYVPSDRDAVARITAAAWFGVSWGELREQQFGILGGKSWIEHKVDEVLRFCDNRPGQVLVAVVDEQVVGYITYTITHQGDVGVVGNNAVDPAFRGKGIGTTLVNQVVAIMEDAGVKMLEVSTTDRDLAAQRVYVKCGFREVGHSITYYREPSRK